MERLTRQTGTLAIAHRLGALGLKVVGCPKTVDNDLSGSDQTFGFDTARATRTDALDKLHTTAESHDRIMILEVMGRYGGFLALESGFAGGADVILIPEIKIKSRASRWRTFSLITVSEGAHPLGGKVSLIESAGDVPGRGVVPLSESKKERRVDPNGEVVRFAKSLGTSFGDG